MTIRRACSSNEVAIEIHLLGSRCTHRLKRRFAKTNGGRKLPPHERDYANKLRCVYGFVQAWCHARRARRACLPILAPKPRSLRPSCAERRSSEADAI